VGLKLFVLYYSPCIVKYYSLLVTTNAAWIEIRWNVY